ncbi:MAG: hypothetical protein HOV77_20045, partial [Hamadaea sp.]|uniref:polymorphic toxin-type HINT domain-containing protein n=1 Tax=Hamadaea sp. TaxID=2024425 RepID=UPI00183A4FDE
LVAGKVAGAMGGFAAKVGGRMIAGFAGGAVSDTASQLATTGRVNWTGVAVSGGIGAVTGSVGGRAGSACHSFQPGTLVVMADGSTKAIKDVKVGDKVLATDPATGENTARVVTLLHKNTDSDLADVTVRDTKTGKASTVHTTQHHPFWSVAAKDWVDASALKPGDRLRDVAGRTTQIVVAVKTWTGLADMRDLTVAEVHTYYVLAGAAPVLVHNNNGSCPVHGAGALPGRNPADCTCRPNRGPDEDGWDGLDHGAPERQDIRITLADERQHQSEVRSSVARGSDAIVKDIKAGHDPILGGVVVVVAVFERGKRWWNNRRNGGS